MKKITLFLCSALLASFTFAQKVDVTFKVDMSSQTVSPNGVHLAGSFGGVQQWSPTAIVMTDANADKVYEVTLSLDTVKTYEFKFINGNDWPMSEVVGASCQVGGGNTNRFVAVGKTAKVLDVVCFNLCSACGIVAPKYAVTFKVDMSAATISPNGVFLAGSMNGWSSTATPLTDANNDKIYEVTLQLEAGTYAYKYVNGATWEAVPSGCAVSENRQVIVGTEAKIIDPLCFNSCASCDAPKYNVTFKVDMTSETVSINGVHLAGTFNTFSPSATALTDANADKVYEVTLALEAGTYEYKFINDNNWDDGNDELVPEACATNNNRTVVVSADKTIDKVCFNLCDDNCLKVSIAENNTTGVSISPNPFSTYTTVNLAGASNRVSVYDVTGKLISSVNTSESSIKIYKNVLENGMYFLVVTNNAGVTSTQKLIVE